MFDRSNEIVRDYELLALVGSGSFASVYKAKHCLIDRIVAIKIIHAELLADYESLQRFKAEATIIANLNHPYIVQLNEFWVDDNGAYIVMEWMAGKSLREYLDEHRVLPVQRVARILAQIAPAFSLVHRKKIIHRDLKPANIMFDEDGDAHIADFGLAKWHTHPTGLSTANASIGTPAYMPPEQVESSGDELTGTADIYSLGIILYELLTGQHPFGENLKVIDMVLHHLRDPLPSILDIIPELPLGIDAVIHKATQKNPEDRYQDVLELADAFQDAINETIDNDPIATSVLSRSGVVPPRGDIHAHLYKKAGAVLEKPRKLVGRDDLVEMVQQKLTDDARILLHGLGGMGKTAIAATIASNYIEQSGNSVIWIELGKQDEHTFFDAIANIFGQQSVMAGKYGDERILAIREILLEQDALLIIDNVWNEQAMIPIMRAIPYGMPTLLTSRKLLSVDGKLIDIDQLGDSDALQLLEHHAGKSYSDDKSAMRLVELLGSHPYAIELAGSRLKIYLHLTPDKLISDIAQSPHDTGQLGQVTKPSVKDLLQESISELDAPLRHLLTMMGGMATTYATLALLAKVIDQDMDSLIEDLAELERNGLIRLNFDNIDLPHYRMHDLTYSYLYFEFMKTGELRRIIEATRIYIHEYVSNYDALELDLMNILGAAKSAQRIDDDKSLIDIMCQLVVEANYFGARGYPQQGIDLLKQAISLALESGDRGSAHYLIAKLGNAYLYFLGDAERAVEAYKESLKQAQFIKDREREALLWIATGTAVHFTGAPEEQIYDCWDKAQTIAESIQNEYVLAFVYLEKSAYEMEKEPADYEKGIQYADASIKAARQGDFSHFLVSGLLNRATAERATQRLNQALDTDMEALAIAENQQNDYQIAEAMYAIGEDYDCLNERDFASKFLNASLHSFMELGSNLQVKNVREFMLEKNYPVKETSKN